MVLAEDGRGRDGGQLLLGGQGVGSVQEAEFRGHPRWVELRVGKAVIGRGDGCVLGVGKGLEDRKVKFDKKFNFGDSIDNILILIISR